MCAYRESTSLIYDILGTYTYVLLLSPGVWTMALW